MKKFFAALAVVFLAFSLLVFALPEKSQAEDKGPLTKTVFIHYKNAQAKPPGRGGGGDPVCFSFLSNGAKWKSVEGYSVNPVGSGLSDPFVLNAVAASDQTWEARGGNIFGAPFLDNSTGFIDGRADGRNTVSFGLYQDSRAIAVTNVWGYFYGPKGSREIVEWDMLFNTFYAWGDALENPALMDLQNIATHELGHSAGLGDLYTNGCAQETMYGYATEGETKKRDLGMGDIAGIVKLYAS